MGAIDENRRELPAALAEYTSAAIASDSATEAPRQPAPISPAAPPPEPSPTRPRLAPSPSTPPVQPPLPSVWTSSPPNIAKPRSPPFSPPPSPAAQRPSRPLQSGPLPRATAWPAVYEASLTQQIALTPDPVSKLELSYTLAASYESRKDLPDATRTIDAVYRANPRILGVVRRTTDFYLRVHQASRAVRHPA